MVVKNVPPHTTTTTTWPGDFFKREAAHYLYFGDSTMFKLILGTKSVCKVGKLKDISHSCCDGTAFMGLRRVSDEEYRFPNPKVYEGPNLSSKELTKKLRHCCGCSCQIHNFTCGNSIITYIPMEYLQDTIYQTPSTNTTQGSIALYLQSLRKRGEKLKIVMSSGFHDMAINRNQMNISSSGYYFPTADYASRVVELIKSFSGYAVEIMWLSMNSPRAFSNSTRGRKWPQTPEKVFEWNFAAYDKINKIVLEDCSLKYLDCQSMSTPFWNKHLDNLHMKPEYYQELGKIILLNM